MERFITIGIAGLQTSNDPDDVLVTDSLGSCIAVILYDPIEHLGGMIHYLLPSARTSPEKAKLRPAMFADTGIPMLFTKMYEQGSAKENIIVKVAGGGVLYDDNGKFDIGRRNYTILRKILEENDVLISAEDVGGSKSRTALVKVKNGEVIVRSRGEKRGL